MQQTLLFTYANSRRKFLPDLGREDEEIYKNVALRAHEGYYRVDNDSFTSRGKLLEALSRCLKTIVSFQFSGHANSKNIFIEGQEMKPGGIFHLLSICPNLKLVILNGCSTLGLLKEIDLRKFRKDIIFITTKRSVSDRIAANFMITFWRAITMNNHSVYKAFQIAIAVELFDNEDTSNGIEQRELGYAEEAGQQLNSSWNIFPENQDQYNFNLDKNEFWDAGRDQHFAPNSVLFGQLHQAFHPYYGTVNVEVVHSERREEEIPILILGALPQPISEQLRKLFAIRLLNGEREEDGFFCEQPDFARLKQIIKTFTSLMKVIAFIHLAQLWKVKSRKAIDLLTYKDQILDFFFLSDEERVNYSYFQLIEIINEIFVKSQVRNFLTELSILLPIEDEDFRVAVLYLEDLNREFRDEKRKPKKYSPLNIKMLCYNAEKRLATVLSKFAFLAKYEMTSIRSIQYIKYRHQFRPSYNHKEVKLIQMLETINEQERGVTWQSLSTGSVFLINEQRKVLNLTPLITDMNAYDRDSKPSPIGKICYFNGYRQKPKNGEKQNVFYFQHAYKEEDIILLKDSDKDFELIEEQFKDLFRKVFNQEL